MKIKELKLKLIKAEEDFAGDYECIHMKQDALLLEYINDKKVTEIFEQTEKWYA